MVGDGMMRRLRALLEPEDLVILAIPLLLAMARQEPGYGALLEKARVMGPLHPVRLVPFLVACGGLWAVIATRDDREIARWDQLPVWAAWAGLLVGAPMLLVILSNGDTGVVYLYAGVFAVGSFAALGLGFSRFALNLSPVARRVAAAPFVCGATWYATDRLVGQYLYDAHHLAMLVTPVRRGDLGALAMGGVEAAFMVGLLAVPYVLMVVFPRFILGDLERPWVWIRRYLWFGVSVGLGLLWLMIEALLSGG